MNAVNVTGERVRQTREAKGLTQAQLAALVGMSQQAVNLIENGTTRQPKRILEIADALGVSAHYLKGLTDDPAPQVSRVRARELLDELPDDVLGEVVAYLAKRRART